MIKTTSLGRIRDFAPIALLGVTASLVLFYAVFNLERHSNEARFRELADQRIAAVRINTAAALDTIAILAGHFEVSLKRGTDRSEFSQLTAPIIDRHPFIQALEWIPRVPKDRREAFETLARQDGISGFHFTERDRDGAMVPVQDRPEYFPVFYVQPMAGNARAQGYDLGSDSVRNAALELARDSGSITSTGRITLVQELGDQYGMLVFAPVFSAPAADVETRRRSLAGYVLGVFRIGDLVTKALNSNQSGSPSQMVDVAVFDLSAAPDSQLLFPKSENRSLDALSRGLHLSSPFDIAGRQWTMLATPGPAFHTYPFYSFGFLGIALIAWTFYLFYLHSNMRRSESAQLLIRHTALSKQRLAEAQRIAHIGHIEFDDEVGMWSISEQCATLLDLQETMASANIRDFFVHADEADANRLIDALDNRVGVDCEVRVGERILHILGESPQSARQQGYFLLTLQDVTRQREAVAERETMIQRIAESNRMEALGTLAGGVAHEINTPTQYVSDNLVFLKDGIATLLDFADAAKSAELPAALAEKLDAMDIEYLKAELPSAVVQSLEGTGRIAKIVQAVKEYSYPTSTSLQPVDLNRLINTVSIVTRNQWKYVAEMVLELAPSLPQISAIEGEINQILVNLIVNAAHAIKAKPSETLGRITIRTRHVDGHVELTVADTGIGIPPENMKKIFEMFFTTKPPGQGTGQGLAITQAIVRRHKGTIAVESTPGEGAAFIITMPMSSKDPFPRSPQDEA